MFLFEIILYIVKKYKNAKFLLTKTTFVIATDAHNLVFLLRATPENIMNYTCTNEYCAVFHILILGRYLQLGWHIFVNFIQHFFSFIWNRTQN
jgi:hypothetical protein